MISDMSHEVRRRQDDDYKDDSELSLGEGK